MTRPSANEHHDQDLLQLIPAMSGSVIEIGCGTGTLAQAFKKINPACRYVGVDSDPDLIALASVHCDDVEVADLDTAGPSFFHRHRLHDCWVLGDALARVKDPWTVLAQIASLMPEHGSIVVDVPNAQHWSIQARLAIGDLRYDRGLLPKSRLRWLTRTTMLDLFEHAGLQMVDGWPQIKDEPYGAQFLEQVHAIAALTGADPAAATEDAKPQRYVVRLVAKAREAVPAQNDATLLDDAAFQARDLRQPKDDYCWAFPVCAFDHSLSGNSRAVFEAVRNDPQIRKIVLTRSRPVPLDGVNVEIVPLASRAAQELLIQSRYIFVKHAPRVNVPYPLDASLHRFINLWHGIPLEVTGHASAGSPARRSQIEAEYAYNHAVIASSPVDRLAMAASFHPLSFHDVWVTGLPRNDHIVRDEAQLPDDFKAQLKRLRAALEGRRLVLFTPTFRNTQADGYYPFSESERAALAECLNANHAVLGVRERSTNNAHDVSQRFSAWGLPSVSLGRDSYPEIELLYREADVLVTDYSNGFFDFMLTGKPEICFAYDLDQHAKPEQGFFYKLEDVFPGPVCSNFDALLAALDTTLHAPREEPDALYRLKRSMFFEHVDDRSGQRVVERVKQEILAERDANTDVPGP